VKETDRGRPWFCLPEGNKGPTTGSDSVRVSARWDGRRLFLCLCHALGCRLYHAALHPAAQDGGRQSGASGRHPAVTPSCTSYPPATPLL